MEEDPVAVTKKRRASDISSSNTSVKKVVLDEECEVEDAPQCVTQGSPSCIDTRENVFGLINEENDFQGLLCNTGNLTSKAAGEADVDGKLISKSSPALPAENEQNGGVSVLTTPSLIQNPIHYPGYSTEPVNTSPQEQETEVTAPVERTEYQSKVEEHSGKSSELPGPEIVTAQTDLYDPGGAGSDFSESNDEAEVTELSQSSSYQSYIAPQLILAFLNETYRHRNVIIKDHFPDLFSFVQAAKDIIRKPAEFKLTKSQFHRLRKVVTKARTEISQQPLKPLDKP